MLREKKITQICPGCGKEFACYRTKFTTYCSRACRSAAVRVSTTCPTCGKTFEYRKSWPRKYCSRECSGKANVTNTGRPTGTTYTATCQNCGAQFATTAKRTRGRFCSLKCYGAWTSLHVRGEAHPGYGKTHGRPAHAGPPVYTNCAVCGKEFLTKSSHLERRRYCSRACHAVAQAEEIAGEANFNWRGGYEPYYGPSWPEAQRAARKRDGACVDCGKTSEENGEELSVHHVRPFREFGREHHEEANVPENLVSLCRVCHTIREKAAQAASLLPP